MKRRLRLLVLMVFILVLSMSTFAFAKTQRVDDGAELLSEEDEKKLLKLVDEISERQQMDVVVVTVKSLNQDIVAFADDYFDYNGFGMGKSGEDGCIIVYNNSNNDCYVSTCGKMIKVLGDEDIQEIGRTVRPYLNKNDFFSAFKSFARLVDDEITQYNTPAPYPYIPFAIVSVLGGFMVALIVTAVMKAKLKSVAFRSNATEYAVDGSLKLQDRRDVFLYSHVERHARPKENTSSGSSTHVSSSGRSHGGGRI